MDKGAFRQRAKENRRNVLNRAAQEDWVLQQLKNHPAVQRAKHIAAYVSFGTELSTSNINRWLLTEKSLYLPRVEGQNMTFHHVTDLDSQLEEGSFHIFEPLVTLPEMERVDVILVPALAYTQDGCRMGYGGGYYDRFLANSDVYKVGICYREQMQDQIPVEEFDIKMNEIICGEV